MSLVILDNKTLENDKFHIGWEKDWDAYMIHDFLKDHFDANRNDEKKCFVVPLHHKIYWVNHLEMINKKLLCETLQVLGRQKNLEMVSPLKEESSENVKLIQKTNPHFYKYRDTSPFCWCFYNGKQSIACDYCHFACCERACRLEMHNSTIQCPQHGLSKAERNFSK